MKKIKQVSLTFLATTLISLSWFLIRKQPLSFRSFSDSYLMFGLLFLMIGSLIAVLSSGFFDTFQRTSKELLQRRKKDQPLEYVPLSEVFKRPPTYWLLTGGLHLLLATVLAYL